MYVHVYRSLLFILLLQGSYEAQLRCDVINVEEPLFLSLNSEVHGLTVSCKINRSKNRDGLTVSSQRLARQLYILYVLKDLVVYQLNFMYNVHVHAP